MTPTHRAKARPEETLTAWRYLPLSPRPIWVVRRFHNLGDGNCLTFTNGTKVRQGDWIMAATEPAQLGDTTGDLIYFMTCDNDTFEENFEPIPPASA